MSFLNPQIVEKIKHYCAYQERCHSEVRYKLVDLGARGEELEEIIVQLVEENYLNEERYAKAIARGKFKYSHWGRVKIKDFLKQKGVSEYCIKKGMKEIDENEYFDTIVKMAIKKAHTLQNEPNLWTKQQKIMRYLIQRGFEIPLVQEIVKDNIS
jgi:regulatory protein